MYLSFPLGQSVTSKAISAFMGTWGSCWEKRLPQESSSHIVKTGPSDSQVQVNFLYHMWCFE